MEVQSPSEVISLVQTIVEEIKRSRFYKNVGYILYPIIVGYFIVKKANLTISLKTKELLLIEPKVIEKYQQVSQDLEYISKEIEIKDTYLIYSLRSKYLNQCKFFLQEISFFTRIEAPFSTEFKEFIMDCHKKFTAFQNKILTYNDLFIKRRIIEYEPLFSLGPFPLDDEQKIAIITDDKHNLVVAGAGSGKTEVLTTRIAYLIKRKPDAIQSERILALAFQRDASQQIRERLIERYNLVVEIKTFHALGREILKKAGSRSDLYGGDNYEKATKDLITELYNQSFEDPTFQTKVIHYLEQIGSPEEKTEADFQTKEEFYRFQRNLRYTALDGTEVKSQGERKILNFFLTHKLNEKPIKIFYEDYADWMAYYDANGQRQVPKPDFFLPEFNIYIEHWSIDNNNQVPPWYAGDYLETMRMKKTKFASQNKYSLVETTFGEFISNQDFIPIVKKKLLEALAKKYPNQSFTFTPIGYHELIENVWEDCKASEKSIYRNINNFITIAKTYCISPKEIQEKLAKEKWTTLQQTFSQVALNIYFNYQQTLKEKDKIDFADMINEAIEILKKNDLLFKDSYDHILIDEYQDISTQRYRLIRTLLEKNPRCKLFCVGDDWQSIMSFAGSNLYYFIDFERHFDHPAISYLTKNYRSIKSIVDTGATIIQNNGDLQLQKKTVALKPDEKKIIVYSLLHKENFQSKYYHQVATHCKEMIESLLAKGYKPNDIMVLTRIYNNPAFNEDFEEYAKTRGIRYSSVHRSKGLQAKLVIILNVNKGLYGFPCELEDPSIFEPARESKLIDKEAEERRLFYVAITRAREDVIIYNQQCARSKFLDEIKNHINIEEVPY